MVATAKRKQTTSSIKDKPVSAEKNEETADAPAQQTESEAQSEMTRNAWLAEAAYYKAEARNFESGHEQEDWLVAEKEYKKEIEKK